MSDWRGWLARKLLSLAARIDPDRELVFDINAEWMFQRHCRLNTLIDGLLEARDAKRL